MKNSFFLSFLLIFSTLPAQEGKWAEKYNNVFPFAKNNHTWCYVQKGKYFGAVTQQGKEILPPIYTNLVINELGAVIVLEKEGKWGTFSPQGKEGAPFMYQEILFDKDRYGLCKRNDKWGYMDTEGEETIPPQYEGATMIHNERASVKMGGKWAIINRQGEFITPFSYDKVENFEQFHAKVKYKGGYGVVDTAGKWLISPMYEEMEQNQQLFSVQKNGKWGFINLKGEEIIPFEYEYANIGSLWTKAGLIAVSQQGKWGYFNPSGMLVVPFEYAEVLTFYDKLAPVRKENKWGFVDNTGTLAIPFKYDSLYGTCWGADWTGAKRDGKWTLISPDGVELMPPTYEQVECILDEDPARVRLNGKWGYINSLGEVVIPCIYDEARKFLNDKGLFEVKKDGKTLFLTKRGREVK